jgi:hypothetical protein
VKKQGYIYTWSPLQYGFIVIGQEVFFLHVSEILQNADNARVGAEVVFEVAPPLPGKQHPRAVKAIVGGAA